MTAGRSDEPTIDYVQLQQTLHAAKGDTRLFQAIVNAPFGYHVQSTLLFLGIIVLRLVDPKTGLVTHYGLSSTEQGANALAVSSIPFKNIKIPLNHPKNIIAKAVRTKQRQDTNDWSLLFTPVLSAEQARINQASAGIAYSAIYPLKARDGGP